MSFNFEGGKEDRWLSGDDFLGEGEADDGEEELEEEVDDGDDDDGDEDEGDEILFGLLEEPFSAGW